MNRMIKSLSWIMITIVLGAGCGGGTQEANDVGGASDMNTSVQGLYVLKSQKLKFDEAGEAHHIEYYTYDQKRRPSTKSYDTDADGNIDIVEYYHYGENRKLHAFERDDDNDGQTDYSEVLRYDTAAHLIEKRYEVSGLTERYTYDGAHLVLFERHDREGNPIYREAYRYTGDLLQAKVYDTDADGNTDREERYTYDAMGNKTLYEVDNEGNEAIDYREAYQYDTAGNMIRKSYDSDADGIYESSETFRYDASGHMTEFAKDMDGDESVYYRETYTYDASGRMLTKNYDQNADGKIEKREAYRYNSFGKIEIFQRDEDGDGTFDYNERYRYDAHGNLLKVLENGHVKQALVWEFVPSGA